jgi:hypothetical protein
MTFKALVGALVAAAVLALSTCVQADHPSGWFMAGSNPKSYESGVAPSGGQNRGPAGFLKSIEPVSGFGTMMQQFNAADYVGKRVRLSAAVRTENVEQWAGLWMRVDASGQSGIAFDNMKDRPIKGTTGWTRYDVVLDVTDGASLIALGVLISGQGVAWLDEVKFEVVPNSIPATRAKPYVSKRAPENLDFSMR